MAKQMKVPRGTERAARREGLHKGWRIHGEGPKMRPAKNAEPALLATHKLRVSKESQEASNARRAEKLAARAAPAETEERGGKVTVRRPAADRSRKAA